MDISAAKRWIGPLIPHVMVAVVVGDYGTHLRAHVDVHVRWRIATRIEILQCCGGRMCTQWHATAQAYLTKNCLQLRRSVGPPHVQGPVFSYMCTSNVLVGASQTGKLMH